MASSFVDISSIKDYEFNTQLVNGSDSQLLNRVLIDENRYGVVNKIDYIPRQNKWYSYNWNDDDYTWTITSNTQTSSIYYATYFNTL